MFLVDIGNSRIKWAVSIDGEFSSLGEAEYVAKELDVQLDVLWSVIEKPHLVAISSVAPPRVIKAINAWVEKNWASDIHIVKSLDRFAGLVNGYVEPGRLGVDRWLSMLAVFEGVKPETPFCVVDCGSAITVDVVAADGQHLGGMIVPGLSMMRSALVKGTSGIRLKDELPVEVSLLARDTEGAVTGGTLYSAVSMIDRVCTDIVSSQGEATQFFITGGDAPMLIPLLEYEFEYDANLVLNGLLIAANSMEHEVVV